MDAVANIMFSNTSEARLCYQIIKKRLLQVYDWYRIAKLPMATFMLTDREGNEVTRIAREGDYVKIDVPGPGTSAGDGYDWVHVEQIASEEGDDMEMAVITLRPSDNPLNDDPGVAHFFKDIATSTLLVKRTGTEVTAEYHGRNEVVNTGTGTLTDTVRNFLVGLTAKMGMSFPQWKSLVAGLVDVNSKESI